MGGAKAQSGIGYLDICARYASRGHSRESEGNAHMGGSEGGRERERDGSPTQSLSVRPAIGCNWLLRSCFFFLFPEVLQRELMLNAASFWKGDGQNQEVKYTDK